MPALTPMPAPALAADSLGGASATAEAVGRHMLGADRATRALGMRVVAVGPGTSTLSMTVRDDMLNGFDTCHGGFITTLADSAFAFACNSRNVATVAAGLTVDFLAPSHAGDVLTAAATEVSRAGRTGVYDVLVTNQLGARIALVRGRSHSIVGKVVIPPGGAEQAP